jgi:hypothetical protein
MVLGRMAVLIGDVEEVVGGTISIVELRSARMDVGRVLDSGRGRGEWRGVGRSLVGRLMGCGWWVGHERGEFVGKVHAVWLAVSLGGELAKGVWEKVVGDEETVGLEGGGRVRGRGGVGGRRGG